MSEQYVKHIGLLGLSKSQYSKSQYSVILLLQIDVYTITNIATISTVTILRTNCGGTATKLSTQHPSRSLLKKLI